MCKGEIYASQFSLIFILEYTYYIYIYKIIYTCQKTEIRTIEAIIFRDKILKRHEARLDKYTSVSREVYVSRHKGGSSEDPP